MEFKVKNKIVEIKFDYRMMFKVDRKLATINQETGASNNDGVGNLFNKILNQEDSGLVDLILLAANRSSLKNVSEDDVLSAIETWLVDNDEKDTGTLFDQIESEMVDSGFFRQKISKYIENMEMLLPFMQNRRELTEEQEMQIKALGELIGKMKNALS